MITPDDYRLTMYALGEQSELDLEDLNEIENALAVSPALRQAVAEIRRSGELVAEALRTEPALELGQTNTALLALAAVLPADEAAAPELHPVEPAAEPARVLVRRHRPLVYSLAVILLVALGTVVYFSEIPPANPVFTATAWLRIENSSYLYVQDDRNTSELVDSSVSNEEVLRRNGYGFANSPTPSADSTALRHSSLNDLNSAGNLANSYDSPDAQNQSLPSGEGEKSGAHELTQKFMVGVGVNSNAGVVGSVTNDQEVDKFEKAISDSNQVKASLNEQPNSELYYETRNGLQQAVPQYNSGGVGETGGPDLDILLDGVAAQGGGKIPKRDSRPGDASSNNKSYSVGTAYGGDPSRLPTPTDKPAQVGASANKYSGTAGSNKWEVRTYHSRAMNEGQGQGYRQGEKPGQEFVGANAGGKKSDLIFKKYGVPVGQSGMMKLSKQKYAASFGPTYYMGTQGEERVDSDEIILSAPLAELTSRITAKEIEQELLKAQYKALQELHARNEIEVDEEAVEEEANRNADIAKLHEEAVSQREMLGKILAVSAKGTQDPKYQALLQVNLELERKKNELLDTARENIRERFKKKQEKVRKMAVDRFESRIASNQLEIDLLREPFFTQREELRKPGDHEVDLQFAAAELQSDEQALDIITDRIRTMRAEWKWPVSVSVLRSAEPPSKAYAHSARGNRNDPSIKMLEWDRLQMALMSSPRVLQEVLARPEIAKHPVVQQQADPQQWIQDNLSFGIGTQSELFLVSFGSSDAKLSAEIANAIVDSYTALKEQRESQRITENSIRVIELLEDERARRMVKIEQEREALQRLASGEEPEPTDREAYDHIPEAPFLAVQDNPLSTFSIDVDTAAYSNMRRFLVNGNLPPAGAVRIEELINYFSYDYPQPDGAEPFSTNVEIASAPWIDKHRLVRIGLQGKKIQPAERPACNLVFLIDTSGSMQHANKLPLVVQSMLLLAEKLGEQDRVGIVTYAGSAGVLLPVVSGDQHEQINAAINSLNAGGSTNGAGGIQAAYELARQNFLEQGVNRVILATDGDFNVGITNQSELVDLIEKEAKSGVFLSVLGYGTDNLNDSTLEKLADKGNGNYAYIDMIGEARKVLIEQLDGTLLTIAKDVKLQIEFNPAHVAAYRLIGYENRTLAKEDFNDDKKDAGEIGSGHTVTALYEIVPAGEEISTPGVDPLKYQQPKKKLSEAAKTDEVFTLKLRYKEPTGDTSKLIERAVKDPGQKFGQATKEFQFAAAVAAFGMKLRHSKYAPGFTLSGIREIAQSAKGADPLGYRAEFVELVKRAEGLGK